MKRIIEQTGVCNCSSLCARVPFPVLLGLCSDRRFSRSAMSRSQTRGAGAHPPGTAAGRSGRTAERSPPTRNKQTEKAPPLQRGPHGITQTLRWLSAQAGIFQTEDVIPPDSKCGANSAVSLMAFDTKKKKKKMQYSSLFLCFSLSLPCHQLKRLSQVPSPP